MFDSVWYYSLTKPMFTPPQWIFPVMWSILYTMMLASLIIFTIKSTPKSKTWGYILFFLQLGLNLCWTPAFFMLHNIAFAFAIIILLDILTFMTIFEFYKISKTAARCLIPYFIWILFATYLNMGYFILN